VRGIIANKILVQALPTAFGPNGAPAISRTCTSTHTICNMGLRNLISWRGDKDAKKKNISLLIKASIKESMNYSEFQTDSIQQAEVIHTRNMG